MKVKVKTSMLLSINCALLNPVYCGEGSFYLLSFLLLLSVYKN